MAGRVVGCTSDWALPFSIVDGSSLGITERRGVAWSLASDVGLSVALQLLVLLTFACDMLIE